MPGFCSCGLSPRPSAGVNGQPLERIGPGEEHHRDEEDDDRGGDAGDIRHAGPRSRRGVSACASAAKSESTTAQNSSEPFCPAQNAEKR